MDPLNGSLDVNMTTFWPGTNLTSYHDDSCFGNITLCIMSGEYCNLDNCDLTLAQIDYRPNLIGNGIVASFFALCILAQLVLGIRYKTWAFMGAINFGLVLEVVGYTGRIMLYRNPFDNNAFLIYLVCLTIAPALLSGAIYLCLARIIVVYGETLSRFKPRTYALSFSSCDFFSLLLQAVGGAIASVANDYSLQQTGINIMIAGLAFQVFSLTVFVAACADFGLRAYRRPQSWNTTHSRLYESKFWKAFLIGLGIATFAILARSCYRVAELNAGFDGPLANDQPTFMVLEAMMIGIAVFCLTAMHPGLSFKGMWAQANFNLRIGKKVDSKSLSIISDDLKTTQVEHGIREIGSNGS